MVEVSGVASFVLGAQGYVWAFGSNRSMEIGFRKEVTQLQIPQRVKTLREQRVVQIVSSRSASGQAHTLVLNAAGVVTTFGTSSGGALGQGELVRQSGPMTLQMTLEVPIRLIACGARHSIMVTDNGRLYSFGDENNGQLGLGRISTKPRDRPELIKGELTHLRVRFVACGDNHVLASTEDDKLFVWGANANGQLGLGRVDDHSSPTQVRELHNTGVSSLACGSRHSIVVTNKGTKVWTFGSNVQGQLGQGPGNFSDGQQRGWPCLCQKLSEQLNMEIVQVAAAGGHSLALTKTGAVYGFGDNTHGQLGFPAPRNSAGGRTPVRSTRELREIDKPQQHKDGVGTLWLPAYVSALSLYKVKAVATAEMHSLALAS
jgi:alpha-tubulin suppressor-like RCC1 family protein